MAQVRLFVATGGPARGETDYAWAFRTRPEALAFLANQHGLTIDEQRALARASRLKLDRRHHGSAACAVVERRLAETEAAKALAGEAIG